MNSIYENILWAIVGALIGIVLEHLILNRIVPLVFSSIKYFEIRKKKKLYYSNNTREYMRKYYGEMVHHCKIGNCAKYISYIVHNEWGNLCVDAFKNADILRCVKTDACEYPIRKRMLKKREMMGQKLFDGPSHFLHSVNCKNGSVHFEIGNYEYFRRISFVNDFEKETYACIFDGNAESVLRNRHVNSNISPNVVTHNTLPLGCDCVVAINLGDTYKIAICERSDKTVNYPGATMVTPSFGFEELDNSGISNPLLFASLKEYSEELFGRDELEIISSHTNPEWFFSAYDEIVDIILALKEERAKFVLNGCGIDAVGGFMNLSVALIVDDIALSQKIYDTAEGNWESKKGSTRFVSINDIELENLLESNMLCPASAFAVQRAIETLANGFSAI